MHLIIERISLARSVCGAQTRQLSQQIVVKPTCRMVVLRKAQVGSTPIF